MSTSSPAQQY